MNEETPQNNNSPQPIVLEKPQKKKKNVGVIAAIIACSIVALIAIVVAVFLLIPNDERTIAKSLTNLKDSKNVTLTISKAKVGSGFKNDPSLKLDLENSRMSGEFEYELDLSSSSVDTVKMNVYGDSNKVYYSGSSLAEVLRGMFDEIVETWPSGNADSFMKDVKFSYEDGWVDAGNDSKDFDGYRVDTLKEKVDDLFSSYNDLEAADVEVISKEETGNGARFTVKVGNDELEISLNKSKEITSISRGDKNDSNYISLSDINSTKVEEIDKKDVHTQDDVMDETKDKLIDGLTELAVDSGIISESDKDEFKKLLEEEYKDSSSLELFS